MRENRRNAKNKDGLEFLLGRRGGQAMRIPWTLFRRILLIVFAIYFIGGAIMFTAQLLQAFDLASPITIGGAALLVAAIAKLIIREDLL